jgi:hypothetical protein
LRHDVNIDVGLTLGFAAALVRFATANNARHFGRAVS